MVGRSLEKRVPQGGLRALGRLLREVQVLEHEHEGVLPRSRHHREGFDERPTERIRGGNPHSPHAEQIGSALIVGRLSKLLAQPVCKHTVGFYTKAPIKTSGLTLEIPTPVADRVEAVSLTAFGDLLESQTTVARLKEAGEYAALVLLMECGHCGYKSPVETQAGEIERQCYCCGAMNSSERWSINVFSGLKMIEI